jgi:hypothetical protein
MLQSQTIIGIQPVLMVCIVEGIHVMASKDLAKKQSSKSPYARILNIVPHAQGFHFCTVGGNSTGVTALGLVDFAEKLKNIDTNSIDFHFRCGDFQKWIREVLVDDELAERISQIERDLCGENLRTELLETVNSRIAHLKTFH